MPESKTSGRAIYSAEPAKGWLPWGLLAPVLAIVFVIAAVAPISVGLQRLNFLDAHGNPVGRVGFYPFLTLPFATLGLVLFAWVHFVERRPLATIGLVRGHVVKTFVRGLAIGCAMTCAIVAATWMAGGYEYGAFAPAFRSPSALLHIALLLAGFGVQSSVEEIVFRGWLLSVLARKFNVVVGVLVSSAVFALLHYDGPSEPPVFAATTFLFGVFAACWALREASVWAIMGWHAGWNWLLAVGFELRVTGLDAHVPALLVKLVPHGPDFVTGGGQGPEGSLACTVLLAVGIGAFGWRAARRRRR